MRLIFATFNSFNYFFCNSKVFCYLFIRATIKQNRHNLFLCKLYSIIYYFANIFRSTFFIVAIVVDIESMQMLMLPRIFATTSSPLLQIRWSWLCIRLCRIIVNQPNVSMASKEHQAQTSGLVPEVIDILPIFLSFNLQNTIYQVFSEIKAIKAPTYY